VNLRLLVLALGTFAIGTDAYVAAGILGSVASSFDVSVAVAGQFMTVYSFAYAVLAPIMATLTAHWPRRRVLVAGLAVFILGNILTATQPTFALALLSRAVAGLGGAMVTPTAFAAAVVLVPAGRRGLALAILMAGISGATALGAPIGTLVSSVGDWRLTIWLVAALGLFATAGALLVLPVVPSSPALRLRERLAPLADPRVVTTLAISFLVNFGAFLVYTYISVVFDRATGGDSARLAILLSVWGVAATVGNLGGGTLADRFGNRIVINAAIVVLALDFTLMLWSGRGLGWAVAAVALWGVCGWSFGVALQHRLVAITPALSPILLGLNTSAVFLAVSASGVAGALALRWLSPHDLPLLSAVLTVGGVFGAELSYRLIRRAECELTAPPLAASLEASRNAGYLR
jgi:MFS transporter, DHA1 family, inner membrane transport protein